MGAGADWRNRREEMGKTLEEASIELRISQRYLRGIEEGDYSRWPPKVFSTGFIRAYAHFLSVDADPVLTEYFGFLEKRPVDEAPFHAKPEWLERERRRGSRRTAYAIATVAVLVIGVFIAWYARHRANILSPLPESGETASSSPLPVPGPVAILPTPPSDNTAERVVLPTPPPGNTAERDVLPTPPSDNAAERDVRAATPSPVSRQETVTAAEGSGAVSAPPHTLLSLFLEASEMTWLMYSHDGSDPVDVMLYPGDRLSIQARDTIYLKIGNAGGVIGTLNGNPLPPFGDKGQVREITLGE